MKRLVFKYELLLTLVILSGCGELISAPGDGAVAASWRVEPAGCEAAGVELVELWGKPTETAYTPTRPWRRLWRGACQAQQLLAEGVPYGAYELKLIGLGEHDKVSYSSPSVFEAILPDALTTLDDVRLEIVPTGLTLRWDAQACMAQMTQGRFELSLFDAASYPVARAEVSCQRGDVRFDDLKAGDYTLLVRDARGQLLLHEALALPLAQRVEHELKL